MSKGKSAIRNSFNLFKFSCISSDCFTLLASGYSVNPPAVDKYPSTVLSAGCEIFTALEKNLSPENYLKRSVR